MRILVDCRSVFPGMGGIGRSTAMLAEALPRVMPAHELHFLLGRRRPASPLSSAPNACMVETDAAMIDPVFEHLVLPGLMDELEADVYHGTCFAVPIPRSRAASVATVHDVVFRRAPDLVEPGLRDYLDRSTEVSCDLADAVVTVSEFSRREIAALYGRRLDAIEVVPNAVEPRFFEGTGRARSDAPYILYVGSIERKKNIEALVHGFHRFLQLTPGARHDLLLAGAQGSGPSGVDLDRLIGERPLIRSRVRLLGHVPDQELPSLYAGASAFAYLSEYEGFGLPPLEAMAAGAPTLVADRASLPEVTQGAALLVDPSSEDEVGRALARLVSEESLRARLREDGPRVARGFSIDESARRLAAIYERVSARRPRHALAGGAG